MAMLGWTVCSALSALALLACGGNADSGGSARTLSCEYNEGGLHYCHEAPGESSGTSGCAEGGGTPGTGCSRTGLAGSCSQGDYTSYFYGSNLVASAVETVCPKGSFRPADDTTEQGDAGIGEGCVVRLTGAYTATLGCSATLMGNDTARISTPDSSWIFALEISGVAPPFPRTFTESTIAEDQSASVSVAPNGANGDIWHALVNRPLYADEGTFSLVIDSVTTDPLYGQQDLHGTLDATLVANSKTEATGMVSVHVEMP